MTNMEREWEDPKRRIRLRRREPITTFFDAFVPKKKDKLGGVAFVRFADLSNIEEMEEKLDQVREHSLQFGKIRDAFVPKKKDKSGGAFAFVRFAEV
ncbi:hypothetical protein QVD17_28386 [Tagetes erecta]|uniref:RRM domain-containing protein n=1 Tax=Tagetes erecta TaxID=13708 RepID=A0AAD8NSE5_TARER|nr:hypothetical protein QVD17_28386 [Tagetes erecta]